MAKGKQGQLYGGRELARVIQENPVLGLLLTRVIQAVNNTATNAGVAAVGKLSPPPPVDNVAVSGTFDADANTITTPGEQIHVTLTHNQAIKKGIRYFTEVDTDPNFRQPHVFDHGASRTAVISMPARTGDDVQQTYYVRSYSQMPGSDPSPITTLGGRDGATKVVLNGGTGGTQQTLPSSKGSGTATPDGQQGGKGMGVVLNRPSPGPKRNIQKPKGTVQQ